MIATGNHNFERPAALCNTLSGEPRRLRRSGRLRASPTVRVESRTIQRSTHFRQLLGGCAARVANLATPTGRVQNWKRIPLNVLHPLSFAALSSSPRGGAKDSKDFGLQYSLPVSLRHEHPRFLSSSLPGGLGHYRIRTGFNAALKINIP